MIRQCCNCACSEAMELETGKKVEVKPRNEDEATAKIVGAPTIGLYCRRNPPNARQVRQNEPVMGTDPKTGELVPQKDRVGRPVTREVVVMQFGFAPVPHMGVCYDGWRPEGTPPGDKYPEARGTDSPGVE